MGSLTFTKGQIIITLSSDDPKALAIQGGADWELSNGEIIILE